MTAAVGTVQCREPHQANSCLAAGKQRLSSLSRLRPPHWPPAGILRAHPLCPGTWYRAGLNSLSPPNGLVPRGPCIRSPPHGFSPRHSSPSPHSHTPPEIQGACTTRARRSDFGKTGLLQSAMGPSHLTGSPKSPFSLEGQGTHNPERLSDSPRHTAGGQLTHSYAIRVLKEGGGSDWDWSVTPSCDCPYLRQSHINWSF